MRFRSLLCVSLSAIALAATAACSTADVDGSSSEDALVAAGTTLVKNARIVDPAKREVFAGALLIKDGKITKVVRGAGAESAAARVIDAHERYVMPGLADLHTHLFFGNSSPHGFEDEPSQDFASQEQLGNRYLYAGVTTYLDLFAPSDAGDDPASTLGPDLNIFNVRERERSAAVAHPRSFVAGPLFMVPGSHGVEFFAAGDIVQVHVKDAEGKPLDDAQLTDVAKKTAARVNALIDAKHPDVVKFVYDNHADLPDERPETMPLAIAKAIIDAAKAKNVKTVAHVGSWKAVEDLANAGLSAFTHLPMGAAPPSALSALRRNDVAAITTMSIYSDYGTMSEAAPRQAFSDALASSTLAPSGLVSAYRDYSRYTDTEKGWVTWGAKHNEADDQGKALRSLIDGKVRILPGTDSGNTGALYGFSVALELRQLEQAGMPTWDILAAATSDAQAFLGQKRGAIAVGYDADLVLLDRDPTEHAGNVAHVSGVILKGQEIDRERLAR